MVGSIQEQRWGELQDQDVWLFTLRNSNGLLLKVTNYGAIVTELHCPDKRGLLADVVLGFDDLTAYLEPHPYFGAMVGRVANRIANSRFSLGGKTFELTANDGSHHLHGGPRGFDKQVWKAEAVTSKSGSSIMLRRTSPDGEGRYPGTVETQVTYTLTEQNEFCVDVRASTSASTLFNLAHHSYWNLAGIGAETILDHELLLHASHYTPGSPIVPDGRVEAVRGTPFDFTEPKLVGRDIAGLVEPPGYDHNFVVDGMQDQLRPVARLRHPESGRIMTLLADQPGVQFYSGNFLDGTLHGKGTTYQKHGGLCLETQCYPNAINVPGWRDQVILRPGAIYRHRMVHQFSTDAS